MITRKRETIYRERESREIADLLCASLDDVGSEVGQLFEEGVLAPHGLGHHLGQLHGTQSRREPSVAAQHIHTGLDQSNSLQNTTSIHMSNSLRYFTSYTCVPYCRWTHTEIEERKEETSMLWWEPSLGCLPYHSGAQPAAGGGRGEPGPTGWSWCGGR